MLLRRQEPRPGAPETHPPRCAYEAKLGNAATEKLHALLNSGAVTMTSIDDFGQSGTLTEGNGGLGVTDEVVGPVKNADCCRLSRSAGLVDANENDLAHDPGEFENAYTKYDHQERAERH